MYTAFLICICILLYTTLVHNTVQNSSNNLPSYRIIQIIANIILWYVEWLRISVCLQLMLNFMSLQVKEPPMKYHGAENIGSGVVYSILGCLLPVAPPVGRGEASHLWVDVQKLCNMCVLSLSWNFFVSHDKYLARRSSKEPRWYTDNTTGTRDFVL